MVSDYFIRNYGVDIHIEGQNGKFVIKGIEADKKREVYAPYDIQNYDIENLKYLYIKKADRNKVSENDKITQISDEIYTDFFIIKDIKRVAHKGNTPQIYRLTCVNTETTKLGSGGVML